MIPAPPDTMLETSAAFGDVAWRVHDHWLFVTLMGSAMFSCLCICSYAGGMVWIRYNPKFGDAISPKQTAEDEITLDGEQSDADSERVAEEAELEREVVSESIAVDYLHWQDYYTFPPNARTEDEIEGKGRRLFMSRQDLIE